MDERPLFLGSQIGVRVDDDFAYIEDDRSKDLNYKRVCAFVAMILDSSLSTKDWFAITESLEKLPHDDDAVVLTADCAQRVEEAVRMVNQLLLRK